MASSTDYSEFDLEQIVSKVETLKRDLNKANARLRTLRALEAGAKPVQITQKSKKVSTKVFDPSQYSTRLIALKFAYLGQNYNGLEYATGNITPRPTVEEVFWAALMKARFIFPTDEEAVAAGRVTWAGCDYTKCGRTDKGVSAFGQVIGLRVRSNRPVPGKRKKKSRPAEDTLAEAHPDQEAESLEAEEEKPFDPIKDEIPYVHILNQLLPSDIRVLAWCSDLPDDFSARFSCRERRYRYFFTNPGFSPTFASAGLAASSSKDSKTGSLRREGWLDIAAMQDAAKRYQGLHDFRNLCKVDSSKQVTDHRRRIFHSEIRELNATEEPAAYVAGQAFSELSNVSNTNGHSSLTLPVPKVYQFALHGSAFLWHQVRHMVAILFLVGQGLESPDIVNKLMDVGKCPQKPHYEMADDAPLVLWDCIFPDLESNSHEDAIKWIYAGDESGSERKEGKGKHDSSGLIPSLWEVWRKRKIDEVLAGSLLNLVAGQGQNKDYVHPRQAGRHKLFLGGNSAMQKGGYTPLIERSTLEHFEIVNARYAKKKGLTPKTEEELQQLKDSRRDKRHDHLQEQ